MLIYGIYCNCIVIHSFYWVQYILSYTRQYKLYWIQIKCPHLMIRWCTIYVILNQKQLLNKTSGSIPALSSSAREHKIAAIWLSCFRNTAKLSTTAHSKQMKVCSSNSHKMLTLHWLPSRSGQKSLTSQCNFAPVKTDRIFISKLILKL